MAGISPNDIWTVGNLLVNNTRLLALFEHWDGIAWKATAGTFHGFFNGVSADASNDIWAVGYTWSSGSRHQTLVLHWNGSAWTQVPSPNVGSFDNHLKGVAALSAAARAALVPQSQGVAQEAEMTYAGGRFNRPGGYRKRWSSADGP